MRGWSRLGAITLMAVFALRAGRLATRQSVTIDEYAHLPCGLAHVVHGDFDMLPWPPPLAQSLLSLPALTLAPTVPHGQVDEWETGRAFAAANRADYHRSFLRSRGLAVALGVALLGCIYAWSRRLWGDRVALIALAVASFEPNLIAHASLVTTDVALTLATVLVLWSASRLIDAPRVTTTLLSGVALGVALLTKLTALILVPVLAIAVVFCTRRRPTAVLRVLLAGLVAVFVIHLGYGFRGSLASLAAVDFATHSGKTLQRSGVRVPLPLPLLRAVDYHRALTRRGWPSYGFGRLMDNAPWYYVPTALALKSTCGFLLLAVAGVVSLLVGLGRARSGGAVLLVLAIAAYLVAGMRSPVNDGVRHVLPLYALVAIAGGAFATRFPRAALVFLCAHGVESLSASGAELAFFNLPSRMLYVDAAEGSYPILGSAVDIGQDLLALRAAVAQRGISEPLHLAYAGRVDPRFYGIDYRLPRAPFEAGWYAISVTHLRGFPYLLLDPETGTHRFARHDEFAWFRTQEPVARAGASIVLYRLEPPRLGVPAVTMNP